MIGPQVSGKESLASHLASRTNAKHLNYGHFVKENELVGKDDDTVVLALIH